MKEETRHQINHGGIDIQKQLRNLEQMPARPLGAVLEDLLKIRTLSKLELEVTVPWTTFHLKSGRDLMGWVVDTCDHLEKKTILVYYSKQGSIDPASTIFDSCFIEVDSIEAVTIHDVSLVAHLLGKGSVSSLLDSTPQTKESLEEKFLKFESFLKDDSNLEMKISVNWDDAKSESIEAMNLLDFVRDFMLGLYPVLQNAEESSSLNDKIQLVHFENSEDFKVNYDNGKLTLSRPLSQTTREWKSPREMIEQVLDKLT